MNGWDGILVTALLAVLVFVVGQAVLRFVLEPVQEQRRLIGEVAHALLFYGNRGPYGFTPEELDETRDHLRGLAGRLRASLFNIPSYDALARLGWVPKRADVIEASTQLVGWSNSLKREDGGGLDRRSLIADKLKISRLMDV